MAVSLCLCSLPSNNTHQGIKTSYSDYSLQFSPWYNRDNTTYLPEWFKTSMNSFIYVYRNNTYTFVMNVIYHIYHVYIIYIKCLVFYAWYGVCTQYMLIIYYKNKTSKTIRKNQNKKNVFKFQICY